MRSTALSASGTGRKQSSGSSNRKVRVKGADGLRVILQATIILHHFQLWGWYYTKAARLGVCAYFCLSAYLLAVNSKPAIDWNSNTTGEFLHKLLVSFPLWWLKWTLRRSLILMIPTALIDYGDQWLVMGTTVWKNPWAYMTWTWYNYPSTFYPSPDEGILPPPGVMAWFISVLIFFAVVTPPVLALSWRLKKNGVTFMAISSFAWLLYCAYVYQSPLYRWHSIYYTPYTWLGQHFFCLSVGLLYQRHNASDARHETKDSLLELPSPTGNGRDSLSPSSSFGDRGLMERAINKKIWAKLLLYTSMISVCALATHQGVGFGILWGPRQSANYISALPLAVMFLMMSSNSLSDDWLLRLLDCRAMQRFAPMVLSVYLLQFAVAWKIPGRGRESLMVVMLIFLIACIHDNDVVKPVRRIVDTYLR